MEDHGVPEGVDWHGEGGTSLRLEDGHVSGSGGVNRLLGSYELDGGSLRLGPLATTMMAGPPERMESERSFLSALERVAGWSLAAPEDGLPALVLLDAHGSELLRLHRRVGG